MRLSSIAPLLFATLSFLAAPAFARPPEKLLREINATYQPGVSSVVTSEETLGVRELAACAKREIEVMGFDPVTQVARKIFVNLYWPLNASDPGELRTILVHPPTGGANKLDLGFANAACFLGFRVAVIKSWELDQETSLDFNLENRKSLRELTAIRHVIEFLEIRRAHQLGLLATSRGAIAGSVAVSFEPRISSAALLVGGGHLAQIISESEESTMRTLREQRMAKFKFKNVSEYYQALKTNIRFEPLDFLDLSPEKPIYLLVAENDVNVPSVCQEALAEGFGSRRTHVVRYQGTHLEGIFEAFLKRGPELLGFFNQTLR